MLTFEPITPQSAPRMRPYYADCSYHLCEYSVGVKLMWGEYLHPSFTEAAGCLIIRNELHGETLFDFPVPGEDGDVDAALTAIEDYCTQKGIAPVISVVLFFVAFALLRMLVSMLVTVLGLVNRLPVIGTVNRWLGWVTGCVASTMDIYLVLCVVWAVIVITGGNLTVLNDTVMSHSLYYKAFNLFNPFL